MNTLYVSYFGALKHLSRTQVIPYLKGLAADGVGVTLLSFEERGADPRMESEARRSLKVELERAGIAWVPQRYHKWPSLPATAWDIAVATVVGFLLVLRHRIDVVHARSHVPAVPALLVKLLLRRRLIFDLRGTMAEEYVDAGIWRRGSLAYRMANWVQRVALRRADAVVVLTAAVRAELARQIPAAELRKVQVIPCCADLSLYTPLGRQQARARLGLRASRIMVYLGSLGGWYLTEEMVRLFRVARRIEPGMHFLILTQTPAVAEQAMAQGAIDEEIFTINTVEPREVPLWLQAADFALALIKPARSKVSSSPTKIGEYLAAGLPVLVNRGIGDVDDLITRHRAGVLIDDLGEKSYSSGVSAMLAILDQDPGIAARCRRAAEQELSLETVGVPRYLGIYRRLAAERAQRG